MLMQDDIKAAIEAVLFVSGERVGSQELSHLLNISEADLKQVMQEMMLEYQQEKRGLQIMALEGGYIMGTKPEYAGVLSQMIKPVRLRLSPAALETLAIIAYQQPVTRAEIEQLRGVKVERILTNLLERGLIKEDGHKAVIGKPIIYRTTYEFLKIFGLSSLNDLPALEVK
ncbi:Chromosome segregation/condensation protein ScpB [Syntrophomonas zehnderi OL-4]|uniref:Chromosome segregation/condensation protein ScpB n=1 Tax=Syntrophomonas zehnderi OL-4 TaxID=690567 RepID=A0A0E3W3N0_9FIRM|nr:SMC-Scp complex subunit ScpB [Syntrophomonas zehnderi]CFX94150.1 Chromosome segregation/condensation protein ScpB [Syntrophomonas zehnderi OL-4]